MPSKVRLLLIICAVSVALCLASCGGAGQGPAGNSDNTAARSGSSENTESTGGSDVTADENAANAGRSSASASENAAGSLTEKEANAPSWNDMTPDRSMELVYADQFSVDYYGDTCELITIEGTGRYLVVEEGQPVPADLPDDMVVIQKPLSNVYLAASSAMDFVDVLEAVPAVTMTSTKKEDWSIASAAEALDTGDMFYIGKYSAPDYEALLEEECSLAIESTMIYHTPEVKEKMESLGIPVLVEHSSYESHPIGRTEWIRLYGVLFDKEDEAEKFFEDQRKVAEEIIAETQVASNRTPDAKNERPTVAFFYITSAGLANVRKPGDYVSEMIRLAGGTYVPDLDGSDSENALSTMNMQMEDFYAGCVDADILIYNATIDCELQTVDDLLAKSPFFKDFKAVKEENVWCTEQDMFQHTTASAEMIREMYQVINGQAENNLSFLHKVD